MWYVVLARPRQEQRAAQNLNSQGGEVFLPTLKVERIKNGKRILCEQVLFPGYLFLRLEQDSPLLSKIRSTFGVRGLLRFGLETVTVADALIEDIRRRCAEGPSRPERFNAGDVVRMTDGPFKDYQAIFQRYNGQERVMLLIELLGQQNKVLVSLEQVGPA